MTRYAIRLKTKGNQYQNSCVMYDAIGVGMVFDQQDAYLFSKLELAEKKAKKYRKNPDWFVEVDIIPVHVSWPQENG